MKPSNSSTARSFTASLAFWFCSLSVALVLLTSQVTEQLASRALGRQSGEKLAQLAQQIADELDQGMYERYREVGILAARSALGDPAVPVARKQALLDDLQRSYPLYAWIGLTDMDGRVLTATHGVLRDADVSQRPWFRDAQHGIHVSDVRDSKLLAAKLPLTDGEPMRFIDLAFPYDRPDGRTAGIVGVHLSWRWAREVERSVMAPIERRSNVEALIVSKDGVVLLGPAGLQGKPADLATARLMAAPSGYLTLPHWSNGNDYLVGVGEARGFAAYPGLGWKVMVRQTTHEAFAPARELQKFVLMASAAAAALFSLFGIFNARRMTRSMRALAQSAQRVMVGQANTIAVDARAYAEVQQLGQSLNTLLDNIEHGRWMLVQANTELERRVHERTEQLMTSEQRLRTIANAMPVLIAYVDREQRYQFCNNTYEAWFGFAADDLIGKTIEQALGSTLYKSLKAKIERTLQGEHVEYDVSREFEGKTQHIRITYIPDLDSALGGGFYILAQDVTEARAMQLVLEHKAAHDPLTGLPNRAGCMLRLQDAMARSRRSGLPMAVMFLDLNRFKQINDTHGHDVGDRVLIEFAARLRQCMRESDLVARLAGDEFIVIAERLVQDADDAQRIAAKILQALSQPMTIGPLSFLVGTSIGIALYLSGQETPSDLLRRADDAMYDAKRAGVNQLAFSNGGFGPAMSALP